MREKKTPLLHTAPPQLAQAAVRHHRRAAKLAHSSGGRKPQLKAPAGLVPGEAFPPGLQVASECSALASLPLLIKTPNLSD